MASTLWTRKAFKQLVTLYGKTAYSCKSTSNLRFASAVSSKRSNHYTDSSINEKCKKFAWKLKQFGYVEANDLEFIHSLLKNSEKLSSANFMLLLQMCGRASPTISKNARSEIANRLWSAGKMYSFDLNISHYNNLLDVQNQNEHSFSPRKILEELNALKMAPNRVTYQRLIQGCCQKGNLDEAKILLEQMGKKSMAIDQQIIKSLILGNARNRDKDGVESALSLARSAGINISADIHGALFRAYTELGDLQKAEKIFTEIEDSVIYLPDPDLTQTIIHFGMKDNLNGFQELLGLLGKKIQRPYIFEAITIFLENRKLYAALELVKTLGSRQIDTLDQTFYPIQLVRLGFEPQIVAEQCKELNSCGQSPWAHQYALYEFLLKRKFDESIKFMRLMKENNIELLDHYFFPLFIHLASCEEDEKMAALQEICSLHPFNSNLLMEKILPLIKWDNREEFLLKVQTLDGKVQSELQDCANVYISSNEEVYAALKFVENDGSNNLSASVLPRLINMDTKVSDIVLITELIMKLLEKAHNPLDVHIQIWKHLVNSLIRPALASNKVTLIELFFAELCRKKFFLSDGQLSEFDLLLDAKMSHSLQYSRQLMEQTFHTDYPLIKLSKERLFHKFNESIKNRRVKNSYVKKYLSLLVKEKDTKKLLDAYKTLKSAKVDMDTSLLQFFAKGFLTPETINELKEVLDTLSSARIARIPLLESIKLFIEGGRIKDALEGIHKYKYFAKTGTLHLDEVVKAAATHMTVEEYYQMERAFVDSRIIPKPFDDCLPVYYHLNKDELEQAYSFYKNIDHRPRHVLKKLVGACMDKENKTIMQELVDQMQLDHGRSRALLLLGFTFIELERIEAAASAFSTNDNMDESSMTLSQAAYWLRNDCPNYVHHLLKVLPMNKKDQRQICLFLVHYYQQNNDIDNALKMREEMVEKGLKLSHKALLQVWLMTHSGGRTPPFECPGLQEDLDSEDTESTLKTEDDPYTKVEAALSEGDFQAAVELVQMAPLEERIHFSEKLIADGHFRLLLELYQDLYAQNIDFPIKATQIQEVLSSSKQNELVFEKFCKEMKGRGDLLIQGHWFRFLWIGGRLEEAKEFYKENMSGAVVYFYPKDFNSMNFASNIREFKDFVSKDTNLSSDMTDFLLACEIACYACEGNFDAANRLISDNEVEKKSLTTQTTEMLKHAEMFYAQAQLQFPFSLNEKPVD